MTVHPMIRITDLDKWYGNYHALRNISLTTRSGERVVICGPSGSSKSTLLRCMNRLERHERGRVEVSGIELNDDARSLARVRQETSMVFPQFNLYPHLSVLKNCTLAPIWVRKYPKRQAEQLAMHFLNRVHIADQTAKYPHQISGGQQQRVAIARTLCMGPKVILFDEPTSALDPEISKEVLDVMIELADDDITMVCVTHEMGFARRVADRVIFMDEGEIVEANEPDGFFDRPHSPRTRKFLDQVFMH
ncbi:amino acid ABC transporter ATP-binding protein [Breoghania sp.]|uniref:amino acid ABC transporter ATP-binding protein n=1 Tax=Breoghania sp. TaxID=2065378 RepID=UPI0026359438|nr:amino acid ABC transporter ATP-binding protein [Breoghania sp.]MDJ0933426.1 amino acid ABC transporter ATP-binding protein [Breoghania sp.]